jgi:hypothetical protein
MRRGAARTRGRRPTFPCPLQKRGPPPCVPPTPAAANLLPIHLFLFLSLSLSLFLLTAAVEADEDAEVDGRPGGPPCAALGAPPVGLLLQQGRQGGPGGVRLGGRHAGLVVGGHGRVEEERGQSCGADRRARTHGEGKSARGEGRPRGRWAARAPSSFSMGGRACARAQTRVLGGARGGLATQGLRVCERCGVHACGAPCHARAELLSEDASEE